MKLVFDGQLVKRLREKRGELQSECAKALNISRVALNAIENGRSKPSLDTFLAMLQHFGVSIDALVRVEDDAA